MGNSHSRRRSSSVNEAYTKPTGLYPSCNWDDKTVRKLILKGKLAPRIPGTENVTSDESEECPICFLNYVGGLNRSLCCRKPICTECYLQCKNPNPSIGVQCPFCNFMPYNTVFEGVLPQSVRDEIQKEEQKVIEAQLRMAEEERIADQERELKRAKERLERSNSVPAPRSPLSAGSASSSSSSTSAAAASAAPAATATSTSSSAGTAGAPRRSHSHRSSSSTSSSSSSSRHRASRHGERERERPSRDPTSVHGSSGNGEPRTSRPSSEREHRRSSRQQPQPQPQESIDASSLSLQDYFRQEFGGFGESEMDQLEAVMIAEAIRMSLNDGPAPNATSSTPQPTATRGGRTATLPAAPAAPFPTESLSLLDIELQNAFQPTPRLPPAPSNALHASSSAPTASASPPTTSPSIMWGRASSSTEPSSALGAAKLATTAHRATASPNMRSPSSSARSPSRTWEEEMLEVAQEFDDDEGAQGSTHAGASGGRLPSPVDDVTAATQQADIPVSSSTPNSVRESVPPTVDGTSPIASSEKAIDSSEEVIASSEEAIASEKGSPRAEGRDSGKPGMKACAATDVEFTWAADDQGSDFGDDGSDDLLLPDNSGTTIPTTKTTTNTTNTNTTNTTTTPTTLPTTLIESADADSSTTAAPPTTSLPAPTSPRALGGLLGDRTCEQPLGDRGAVVELPARGGSEELLSPRRDPVVALRDRPVTHVPLSDRGSRESAGSSSSSSGGGGGSNNDNADGNDSSKRRGTSEGGGGATSDAARTDESSGGTPTRGAVASNAPALEASEDANSSFVAVGVSEAPQPPLAPACNSAAAAATAAATSAPPSSSLPASDENLAGVCGDSDEEEQLALALSLSMTSQ